MIKLNILLEELIMELTASEIREKYYSDIDANVFNSLVKADPGTVVKDDNIVKIGKYAKILINLYKKNNLKLEDLPKANEYLTIIYKKRIGLDANKVNNLTDIYELVKDFVIRDGETDINKILESLTNEDYELKLNGEEWYIFKPLTIKGASLLGSATEWCTTWGALSTNPKHRDRSNRFEYYDNQGPMYIFINKKDNTLKYQFHAASSQYMNSSDRQIPLDDFLTKNKEILLYFNPEIKTGIDNLEVDELTRIMNRPYINLNFKSDVVNTIAKKSDNNIIKNIVGVLNGDGADDLIEKINEELAAARSDFKIYDIDSKDISFYKLDFQNLDYYDKLSRYNSDYDDYDDDDSHLFNDLMEIVINKRKNNIEADFLSNHLDLTDFLEYLNKNFSEFISEDLIMNFTNGIVEDLNRLNNEKMNEIRESNVDVLTDKARKLFSISSNTIKTNIFMHFLIYAEGDYSYDYFEDFIDRVYDLPSDISNIHEVIEDGVYNYRISDEEYLNIYDRYHDYIIENFIERNDDEITAFHNQENDDDYPVFQDKLYKLQQQIYFILKKFRGNTNTRLRNENYGLDIIMNKINVNDETVYINFVSEINDNSNYTGFVKITDLPRYINYGEVTEKFYTKLKRILKDMGLNPDTDTFENEHVKIDLDYSKVDEDKETIFIKFKNKDTGKELSGSVGIESLPTHFSNYKLFETINRFKKLI